MKVLLYHAETRYFAGAQKVLGYFAEGCHRTPELQVALAAPEGGRLELAAGRFDTRFPVADGAGQSPAKMLRNAVVLAGIVRRWAPEVLHAWAARDWEVAALAGRLAGVPVVGTLHDHPEASFISAGRRRVMRGAANLGLDRVACVSRAVQQACVRSGYAPSFLRKVPNGLPARPLMRGARSGPVRLGYLGAFSSRKGFTEFFELLDRLDPLWADWEGRVAGGALGPDGERLEAEVRSRFGGRAWWPKVLFTGWTDDPAAFLDMLDLLVVPSREFDPYPTVLLEAAWSGLPVFAAAVGGVPEIVLPDRTGVLFDPKDVPHAAKLLAGMFREGRLPEMGREARALAERSFGIESMIASYLRLYSEF